MTTLAFNRACVDRSITLARDVSRAFQVHPPDCAHSTVSDWERMGLENDEVSDWMLGWDAPQMDHLCSEYSPASVAATT